MRDWTRREFITTVSAAATLAAFPFDRAFAQGVAGTSNRDRVVICNEDSNTLSVIDPNTNTADTTINLTSFDEDPRPPFRLVTGGVTPTHLAMVTKPLYHGAINIHGAAPSPDNKLLACTGRDTSNVYLIDLETMKVIGNTPNSQASEQTNGERITGGVMVGREPHEPTFSRNGKEIWVTVRGENRIAILDTASAIKESGGVASRAVRLYVNCLNGPAQVWFSADGRLAFVASQKTSQLEVFETNFGRDGFSRPKRRVLLDIKAQDPFAFTPFQKTTPDGKELWLSHKLADAVSVWSVGQEPKLVDAVPLGELARPNTLNSWRTRKARLSMRRSPAWTTVAPVEGLRVRSRLSIARRRQGAEKSSVTFSAKRVKRTACGQIRKTRCSTSPTNRMNCRIRPTPGRLFALPSMSAIPSSRASSRKSPSANSRSLPASCGIRRASTSSMCARAHVAKPPKEGTV